MIRRFARPLALLLFIMFNTLVFTQLSPLSVSAVDPNAEVCKSVSKAPEKPIFCTDTTTSNPIFGPTGILTKVIQAFVYAAGIISVVVIIIGGFRYVVSGGDSGSTKGAKDSILYALVGLVVTIFAQAIVAFVLKKL
jgi:hypothetical protein